MSCKLLLTSDEDYGLLPLWEAIYSIYEEFARICDKHGLRYYALGGTLLGAIRHNGFIPWDDDLDVAMPRPDYERFIELSKKELPHHLRFMNWRNTPELQALFGKVQETRREIVTNLEKQLNIVLSNGVYIDIFPLDGYPESWMERSLVKMKHLFLSFVWHYLTRDIKECKIKGKIACALGMVISKILPGLKTVEDLMRIFEDDAKKTLFEFSNLVADVSIYNDIFKYPPQQRKSWGSPKSHIFNGKRMNVPENPDDPLTSRFGKDYMTPPPRDKRKSTHRYDSHFPWWLGPTRDANK